MTNTAIIEVCAVLLAGLWGWFVHRQASRLSFCQGQWLAVILAPAAWWLGVFVLIVGAGIPDWLWVPALGAWYPMAGALLITIIVLRRPNAILTVAACFLLAAGAHLAGFISQTVLRIAANGCLPGAYT